MTDLTQTFPSGPAFSALGYKTNIKLFGVDDTGNPTKPGWLTPDQIVNATLGAINAAFLQGAGAVLAENGYLQGAPTADAPPLADNSSRVITSGWAVSYISGLGFGAAIAAETLARQQSEAALTSSVATAAGNAQAAMTAASSASSAASANTAAIASLTPKATNTALVFVFAGKPAANQVVTIPIPFACLIPASWGGALTFANSLASNNATFTGKKISGGSASTIGTITATSASATSATLSSQAAVACAARDALQFIAPAVPDGSLADFTITIPIQKA